MENFENKGYTIVIYQCQKRQGQKTKLNAIVLWEKGRFATLVTFDLQGMHNVLIRADVEKNRWIHLRTR